ncbi:MAG: TSUP family transporter [Gaiellaceae bacterium]
MAAGGTTLRLVLIGLAAGALSALFGVGGGIVIVPLLLLWAGFEQRPASATSLAAIGLIAAAGVVLYALRGHVEVGPALLVGLPAAAGAVFGTVLQQRLPVRTLAYAFALLLAALGLRLVVA